jgi:chromosome segregation ATPase
MSALLKYEACERSVSSLEQDIESYKVRIASLGELDKKYEALLGKKERLISTSGNAISGEVLELSESIADTKSDLKEIGEAISAGQKALYGLDKVKSSLESAKSWGTFDMLGGGLITTAFKHSRIDDAKEAVHQVQRQLLFFQKELADIGTNTEIKIEISSFSKFADYFFDGLIFDWAVQSKINRSLDNVLDVSKRIHRVVLHLQKRYKEIESKYNNLEQEKRKLIEQA